MAFLQDLVKKIRQGAADVGQINHAVAAQVNPFDHGQTAATVMAQPRPVLQTPPQNVFQAVTQAPAGALNVASHIFPQAAAYRMGAQAFQNLPTAYNAVKSIPAIHNNLSNPVTRFVDNSFIQPLVNTEGHVGSLAQYHNPYQGSIKQQVGQVGQDALNIASVVPVGKAADVAMQGGRLLPRVAQGAKMGATYGASFGGGQGLAASLQNNANLPTTLRNIGVNTALGGVAGGVLGGGLPVAGAAGRVGIKIAKNPGQVVQKLDQAVASTPAMRVAVKDQNILRDFADMHSGAYNPNPSERSNLIKQAYQISDKYGVNLKTGTPADLADRSAQMLDVIGKARQNVAQRGAVGNLDPFEQQIAKGMAGLKKLDQVTAQSKKLTQNMDNELALVGKGTSSSPEDFARVMDNKLALNRVSSGVAQPTLPAPPAERYPSQPPKVSPQPVVPLATPKNAQPILPGSGNVRGIRIAPQEQSLPIRVGTQSVVSPSLDSTPKRGFVQSVNKSGEVSPTVANRATGTYQVRNTDQLAAKAEQFASKDLGKATEAVSSALSKKRGNISDQEVANAISVAKKHDANQNYSQATDIYENLAKHLTAQGQAIQAASLLDRRTPEGLRYQITKVFKQHNVTPSKDVLDQIDSKMRDIKATKPGTEQRVLATKQLQKIVADSLPSNLADKGIAFWKAGLLTGMRTQTGNMLSNETFSVLHNLSNPLAAGLDKGISFATGQRTKTLTGRGLVSGTGEGFKRGATFLKTGIDERSTLTNKFDARQVNFKNKALNTYVNGVFKLMGAADRPHYYRQLRNSLNDLAIADGKNQGLSGQALRNHVNNFIQDPPTQAFQTATSEAEKGVLANDTVLSRAVEKVRLSTENAESPLGKAVTEAAINLLMPFTKVPSAFISRVVDYTPVGAIKTIAGQISRGRFDQRALVTAISESTTGTGLMYLGYKLSQAKLLSGNYPSDTKEQQRWKAEGIQPNSIKVGDKWINLNYAGPLGLLFGAGARISDAKNQGDGWTQQQIQAYAGMPKDLTQQSFLQGLSGAMQAINEPGRYASNYVKSQASSTIPTLLGDIATATDSQQRQSNSAKESIQAKIPGARMALNPAQDVYGNNLSNKTSPLSAMINPFRPTTDMSNKTPSVQEVNRLHNVDSNNKDLQVTPTQVGRTLTIEKSNIPLTDQQRYNLQKAVGQATQNTWNNLISTPEYQALDDVSKANALNRARQSAAEDATRAFVVSNNLGSYTKPESTAAINLSSGNVTQFAKDKNAMGTPKVPGTTKGAGTPKVPTTSNTTYDPLSNTWTRITPSTGRTVQVASDGTQTVTENGIGRISNARSDYVTNITTLAKKYNVDPYAALAVAASEGLGGGVGDNGTSFGPFQLHIGGALPAGKDQKWAESPEGIDYALQQIGKVAAGKKGADAIAAIVQGFEKPLNPANEITNATSIYGGKAATLSPGSARSIKLASSKNGSGGTKGVKIASAPAIKFFKLPNINAASGIPKSKGVRVRQVKQVSAKISKAKGIRVRTSKA